MNDFWDGVLDDVIEPVETKGPKSFWDDYLPDEPKSDADALADTFGTEKAAEAAIFGNMPEGEEFFLNPQTGQMTSRELLTNHHRQNATQGGAALDMAGHGATLGTSDEAAGLGGFLSGKEGGGQFARENRRAEIDANRMEFPFTSLGAEMAGGVAVPASVLRGGNQAATTGQAVKKGTMTGAATGSFYAAAEGEGGALNRLRDVPVGFVSGAAGGAVAVPIAKAVAWAGKTLGKPIARLFSDRRYYNEAQGLTDAGKEAAKALGHDPDAISAAFAREFGGNLEKGIPAKSAAASAEMAEFGIPAFKQNVTGDVNDFADFDRLRKGVGSPGVVSKVQDASAKQQAAARTAVDDVATEIGGGVRGDQFDAAQAVTGRLDDIKAGDKAAAKAAYEAADSAGVSVPADVAKGIHDRIGTRLAAEEVDVTSDLFAKTRGYMTRLQKREVVKDGVSLKLIDTFRKDLNKTMGRADSEDLRALKIVKDEYDAWIDDVVTAKLFDGSEEGFADLKNARALWGTYAKKYMGKDAGSRFIRDMVDRDASPEQVMKWMFGASKMGTGRMNSKLAGTLKDVLGAESNEWNMLRQAAFRQLAQKPGTEAVDEASGVIPWGPQKVSQNILSFVNSPQNRALVETLFSKQEQAQLKRLGSALKRMVPPDGAVNHSNTAIESARMAQKAWGAVTQLLGYAAGGPAGAVGAGVATKASAKGADWLKAAKLLNPTKASTKVRGVAAGAIPAVQGGVATQDAVTRILFPFRPEQDRHR